VDAVTPAASESDALSACSPQSLAMSDRKAPSSPADLLVRGATLVATCDDAGTELPAHDVQSGIDPGRGPRAGHDPVLLDDDASVIPLSAALPAGSRSASNTLCRAWSPGTGANINPSVFG